MFDYSAASFIICAYILSAGILFWNGVQSIMLARTAGSDRRISLSFACCCLCAAGYQIFTAQYSIAPTLREAANALRWQTACAFAFFPAFIAYVAALAGQPCGKRCLIVAVSVFGMLLIANQASEYGLRYDTPARFTPSMSVWNAVGYLAIAGTLLWALARSRRIYRLGERRMALSLAFSAGLLIAAGGWDLLSDWRVTAPYYLTGFGFFGFVIWHGTLMTLEVRNRIDSLKSADSRLRTEIERRMRIERILSDLRSGISRQFGTAFLEGLVQRLTQHFDVDYALIGLLDEPGRNSITTLAACERGALTSNLSYPLTGSPCAQVIGRHCTQIYETDVRAKFPDDALIQAWNVDSYIGTSFFDSTGQPLGIVVMAGTHPLKDTEMIIEALDVFAARIGAEVGRLKAEMALRHSHAILQTLSDVQRDFLLNRDVAITFEHMLNPLLNLSESQYGFIGEVLIDEAGRLYLKTHVYSNVVWDADTRHLYENTLQNGLEFHNLNSLIGAVLTSGKAVLSNDAPHDHRRAGLPSGHPAIDSFLGLPIYQGDDMIGMIGLANRPGGYNLEIAASLDPFLSTCAALLTGYHAERKRQAMKAKMLESEERFHVLADSLPIKIWMADLEGRCLWFNRAWLDFTGRPMEEELGYGWLNDVHPRDRDVCLNGYQNAMAAKEPVVLEYRLRRHDGQFRTVLDTMAPRLLPDGAVVGFVGACIDLTEHRALQARVEHLAYHDALTGLPNRALLSTRIEQTLSFARISGHQAAVLFVDLDRFKTINDSLGHALGDLLLRETGLRLGQVLRKGDTVARMGGDEFVILLPRIFSARETALVAEKILAVLALPFDLSGYTLHVTTSIGISLFPQDGQDGDTLIKHADVALYQAKARGRNNFQFFDPVMTEAGEQRLMLENDLRKALLRDEFILYYQPRIDLSTGSVTSVEALIRWQHPQRGLLAPNAFIHLAEEIGLIGEIGHWVLNTACRQLRDWRSEGLTDLRMAVNVSARQLHDSAFHCLVEKTLLDAMLPAACLELELTESCVMDNPEKAIVVLNTISRLGVRIAIDDFGTGYSSLAYLKRLPVTCLKIDRAFVQGIPEDAEDVAIAETILSMAKHLGLVVVAEGIETEAQCDFLARRHCKEGQGYWFSRPLPAGDLINFINSTVPT
ncbi:MULTISPECIES: EAL domain-containing protein [Methylomicrobium]|uniref:cyclic-guanylate-specific phosphodiesterase n=1 Tax=Methylomicrobium album BG8 TaxID=686340 RepID=H8GH78_METAL|nr:MULTISPECIES: EAL domain-containing protein [Methylomicrobium]EIC28869.1 PAS domain S-box/diguanylate cyclase (GGDEF) domain-containing protein [Methylomicrobium album BG8]